ncbi:MAG: hypothetical protein HY202_00780 [Nitrospirae bacterium]|nr:hypothetical protein [Nitrospirota bacterium]
MFRFESLELLYWDCWERFKIPLDSRVITVTGPNGSGKTTLLDALRTLLAAKTSEKRDYKKYARRPNKPHSWIIGVVTNKRDGKGRPPFFPILAEKVTLACHINRKGGDWQREYYVLPGNLSLEEILKASENPSDIFFKPKGIREYQTELEKAGLSHAMLTVLALEQGATDKLCEYPPKELLKLVYAVFGDKPTLENYEKAIQDQKEAEKELEELRLKVARLENQCTSLRNRVNNYRDYEKLVFDRTRLETEVSAQARYVELYDRIKGAWSPIVGLKRVLAELEKKEESLLDHEKKVVQEEAELKETIELTGATLNEIQTALIQENRSRSVVETQLDEIKILKEACQDVQPEPVETLQSSLESTLRQKFLLEQQKTELDQRLKELEEEKESLLSNRLKPDRPVELFHQRLMETGISHSFLYENIEVVDERWRIAIESILKGFRYVILLENPADRWRAWEMGEREGYRHFIVGEEGKTVVHPPAGSSLEAVRLSEKVPAWVRRQLAEIRLVAGVEEGKKLSDGTTFVTQKGFIRERRGGRSIAVEGADFAFGQAGRKKRLESIEIQIGEFNARKTQLAGRLTEINTDLAELKQRMIRQENLQKYLLKKDEEAHLKQTLQTVLAGLVDLEKKQESLFQEKQKLEEKRLQVTRVLAEIRKDIEIVRGTLDKSRRDRFSQRTERCKLYQELQKQRAVIPATWRTSDALSKYRKDFEGIKDVQREIEKTEKRLLEGQWEKDPSVIKLKAKVEKDYEGEKSNLESKEAELSRTAQVTGDARSAYIDYLRTSIRFYEANLKTLSSMAGVGIEVIKPHLENDEMVLREAGLEVKWNFDQKGFTSTDDGEGSGGQQVMKSLILLIALLMAEGDSGGFVFVDEPFAHLDVFNIDRVAAFLMATNTQYIITSPNSHNTNVYKPAFLTIVTRKKGPDRLFADPPGYLRRMEPTDA